MGHFTAAAVALCVLCPVASALANPDGFYFDTGDHYAVGKPVTLDLLTTFPNVSGGTVVFGQTNDASYGLPGDSGVTTTIGTARLLASSLGPNLASARVTLTSGYGYISVDYSQVGDNPVSFAVPNADAFFTGGNLLGNIGQITLTGGNRTGIGLLTFGFAPQTLTIPPTGMLTVINPLTGLAISSIAITDAPITFASLDVPKGISSVEVVYSGDANNAAFTQTLDVPADVPEPEALGLLATALFGLGLAGTTRARA